ncbi:RraA family protein [Candidatus Aerophobetes bacterium]|uniref:Regulator of ribonuclease activity homolog n=1 Tax=Aerophobetes bacterium TaxID=2030807 RepID=A0A523RXY4_UNCAE|nr:MAG: RraA family protein [Candidatus Aerophobetes bacterium]
MKKRITTDLFERLEKLYTGLVCDVLDDELGFRNNVYIMSHEIRPLYFGAVVTGRVATALAVPVYTEPEKPYQRELEFIDSLEPGDVVVATQSGVMNAGLWGGLLSTGARYRGARGAVVDGITRDTKAIMGMKFPVFIRGIAPADSKGRIDVINHHLPIKCAGVWVNPGDVIFGDNDGVVVVPQDIAVDIVRLAEEKYKKEKNFEEGLRKGATVAEMFEKYRVL